MLAKAPKGTKDIMPDQIYKWQYVERKFKEQAERYGFKEIRTPMFEHTELFKRGVGDTSDVVQKEMFTFEDRGRRDLALKPEGTASVARAFLEHNQYAEVQPAKYFYITPCYRDEQPQAGRQKEFHQFGVECFGAKGMLADLEIISVGYDFLRSLGITEFELRINSVGCPKCREEYKKALQDYYRPYFDALCDTCKDRFYRNPMRLIDCKSPEDHAFAVNAPSILDYLCEDCRNAFEDLKAGLDTAGIPYVVDPTIVRGLDYYTKTAFEFVTDRIGAQSTICGGGRYDNLISEIGGMDVPGVGFGLGIERLLLLMDSAGIEIPEDPGMDALIIFMGPAARSKAIQIAGALRRKGLRADLDSLERNLKGQLKYADRKGYRCAVIIGDNELASGQCQVKNLLESTQESVAFDELSDVIRKSIR